MAGRWMELLDEGEGRVDASEDEPDAVGEGSSADRVRPPLGLEVAAGAADETGRPLATLIPPERMEDIEASGARLAAADGARRECEKEWWRVDERRACCCKSRSLLKSAAAEANSASRERLGARLLICDDKEPDAADAVEKVGDGDE